VKFADVAEKRDQKNATNSIISLEKTVLLRQRGSQHFTICGLRPWCRTKMSKRVLFVAGFHAIFSSFGEHENSVMPTVGEFSEIKFF
jgi:hypothetical protein